MSGTGRIEKGSVEETLVLPLYGRSEANRRFPSVFRDTGAAETMSRLDYDFSSASMGEVATLVYGLRQEVAVEAARRYLGRYPDATVVNLGAGLDDAFGRMDNGRCTFVSLDLPDVIGLRRSVYGERDREAMLPGDLEDVSWVDLIPGDRVFTFSCGVLMYLHPQAVSAMVAALADRFRDGGLLFDFENSRAVRMSDRMVRRTGNKGAEMRFWLDDPEKEIRGMSGRIDSVDVMRRLPEGFSDLPFKERLILNHLLKRGAVSFADVRFSPRPADGGRRPRILRRLYL